VGGRFGERHGAACGPKSYGAEQAIIACSVYYSHTQYMPRRGAACDRPPAPRHRACGAQVANLQEIKRLENIVLKDPRCAPAAPAPSPQRARRRRAERGRACASPPRQLQGVLPADDRPRRRGARWASAHPTAEPPPTPRPRAERGPPQTVCAGMTSVLNFFHPRAPPEGPAMVAEVRKGPILRACSDRPTARAVAVGSRSPACSGHPELRPDGPHEPAAGAHSR
jgi:hypothetical protein